MKSDEITMTEERDTNAGTSIHLRQLVSVYAVQMKLYSKNVSTYIYIFVALLIPILAYSGTLEKISLGSMVNVAYLLILLPIMIALIPSRFAGKIMPMEFKNRTSFINFPLPMSRMTFYVGKFLAAFTLSMTVLLLALGGAIISGDLFLPSYPNDIAAMVMISVAGMFAILCMTYFFSMIMGRGAGPLVTVITVFVPFIVLYFTLLSLTGDVMPEHLMGVVGLLPMFTPYQALWSVDHGFASGFVDMAFATSYSPLLYVGVSIIWGVVFLILGAIIMRGKDI